MGQDAVTNNGEQFSIFQCVKALDSLEGIDQASYFSALDLFEHSHFRELFMSLKSEKQLMWLQMKCKVPCQTSHDLPEEPQIPSVSSVSLHTGQYSTPLQTRTASTSILSSHDLPEEPQLSSVSSVSLNTGQYSTPLQTRTASTSILSSNDLPEEQQLSSVSSVSLNTGQYSSPFSNTRLQSSSVQTPIASNSIFASLNLNEQPQISRFSNIGVNYSSVQTPIASTSTGASHNLPEDQQIHTIPDFSPVHIGLSPTTRGAGDIKVNSYFKNKEELMSRMKQWALEWKFEYKTEHSNKSRVILVCVGKDCSWRMRATKLPTSDIFVVKKYTHEHSCDTTHRNANHRQASAKLLGTMVCSNYGEKKEGLKPKQIIEQVRIQHGVHINYKKAWRIKEEAQRLVRGTPEDSYFNLAKWLYKLKEKNPGSLTFLEVDDAGKFKYTFIAFGPSIRGFSFMRRVIAVDGTFLKGKFRGTLLGASAQDGNYHLYPLAFAVVDNETEPAWTWFFRGLIQMIPDASDLVFVSDRAPAIAKALAKIYPLAHHGICRIHLISNIKPKHGKSGLLPLVENAADAYTYHEFSAIFSVIKEKNPVLAEYLEESDFRKWARCFAPSNRYNIMTTNIAESLNSLLKLPREMPLISLLETIRLTLTTWFYERREAAAKHRHLVTPKVVKKLISRFDAAMKMNVYQVDRFEFEVKDDTNKFVVHLENKHCTCNVFDVDKIPCIHAIAAAKRSKLDENQYVDVSYSTETWAKAYAESIHPCGDLSVGTFPDIVSEYSCPPPATKKSSGRPPTKRIRSVGEFGVPGSKSQSHKCSRCGIGGHNKSTCKTAI